MLRFDTPPARLRTVAVLEGLSYVVLLFVAMPLKYVWDDPTAVTHVGRIHGALFVLLAWMVFRRLGTDGRTLGWGTRIGIASIVPFGTFYIDGELRAEDDEFRRSNDL